MTKTLDCRVLPYRLKTNLSGLAYLTPVFSKRKQSNKNEFAEREFDREYVDSLRYEGDYLVEAKQDSEGNVISIAEYKQKKQAFINDKKPKYARRNKISELGTNLNISGKEAIKNAIFYRYYSTTGNRFEQMKFFTFTIQKSHYLKQLENWQYQGLRADQQEALGFKGNAEKIRKMNVHPDTFFNQKLSQVLENLTKRQKQRLYGYTWVAEKTKEGVIHYHCIFECENISAKELSSYWAKTCGFTDFQNSVHYGFKNDKNERKQIKWNNIDPESLASYLTGYVTKVKNSAPIFGRCYGMSSNYTKFAAQGEAIVMNASVYIRENEVSEGEKKDAVISFEVPKLFIDMETGEQFQEPQEVIVNCKLFAEKHIDTGRSLIPYYILIIDKEILIKTFYQELYKRSQKLFRQKPRVYNTIPQKELVYS
jgi:hypothetical protein